MPVRLLRALDERAISESRFRKATNAVPGDSCSQAAVARICESPVEGIFQRARLKSRGRENRDLAGVKEKVFELRGGG